MVLHAKNRDFDTHACPSPPWPRPTGCVTRAADPATTPSACQYDGDVRVSTVIRPEAANPHPRRWEGWRRRPGGSASDCIARRLPPRPSFSAWMICRGTRKLVAYNPWHPGLGLRLEAGPSTSADRGAKRSKSQPACWI